MNYYRRYLGDYMRDTMHLSMLEHGAYGLLLDAQYATDKALPTSFEALYRLCRAMTKVEQDAVRSVAEQFFPVDGDVRWNPRAKREVSIAQSTIQKQRDSGVESANKRWSTQRSTQRSTHESTYRSSGGSAIQPPTTNHQPPTTNLQPPSANHQPVKRSAGVAARPPARRKSGEEPATAKIWLSYAAAYEQRYGVAPTRNGRVNAQIAQFVSRVPVDDAPEIAAFYVRHNKSFYVSQRHAVGMLLKDAEGLRTEWLSGRQVTDTEARQADRTQARASAFAPLLAEAEERERVANGE